MFKSCHSDQLFELQIKILFFSLFALRGKGRQLWRQIVPLAPRAFLPAMDNLRATRVGSSSKEFVAPRTANRAHAPTGVGGSPRRAPS